ncbi:hypothetical protein [Haloquadratum walsbyi]|uniref:Uncharacterized protein n=1 Tax=Haloquadratum walsbyi (strain DSM 16790 / HBSQ001) TaxID=362976 RepID=Q18JS8_HALWD|nr:hypothetical protein [Haloquadratum walsbyi]CAJ51726.2 uncharacterized protein HQ_1598A [Haloquadratum walsbyi DSM 16790]
MQRRKLIAGIGSVAAGAAAVTGTGALTSVNAERSIAVDVADDSDAFLAITPQRTSNGSEYASTSDGEIKFDFTETSVGGGGLNRNAETIIRDILQVRNQGTQDLIVGVTGLPEFMSIFSDDGSVAANGNSTSLNQDNNSPSSGNLALLRVGETMNDVGVIFRLNGEDASVLENFSGTLTFKAVAVRDLSNPDEVRNKYGLDEIASDPEPQTGTGGPESLVTAEVDDGATTTITMNVNDQIESVDGEFPANDTSFLVEANLDISSDGFGESQNDDMRFSYAGKDSAERPAATSDGGSLKRNTGTDGNTNRETTIEEELEGFSAEEVNNPNGEGYELTITWSELADDEGANLNRVPSEFQVNEVFISDGGGGIGQNSANPRALGINETYSTD